MEALLRALRSTVRNHAPKAIAAIVLLTVVFGVLARQAEQTAGFENFAPDNEISQTFEAIEDEFASAAVQTSQLVVFAPGGGDVLSAAGVQYALHLRQRVAEIDDLAAGLATQQPTGPVFTYADLVLQAAQDQQIDPMTLDDAAVDAIFAQAAAAMPEAQRGRVIQSLGDYDPATQTAAVGAAVLFLDGDLDPAVLEKARSATAELEEEFQGLQIRSFDFMVLSDEVTTEVQTQLSRLLGLAFLLILLILVGIYRRASDVITSLVGLVMTIVWMQGISALLGPKFLGLTGGMNEMAMMIPILLVGLGVDYGIHLTMRYREDRAHGHEPREAADTAIRAVGAALTLATITTVVGFATNVTNPLPPLQDFGVFAAAGVLSAFVVMATFVPAVRLVLDERAARKGKLAPVPGHGEGQPGILGRISSAFAPYATHHPWTVLSVAALVTVAGLVASSGLSTEFSQTEFFPSDSEALDTINTVQDSFGGDLTETTDILVRGDLSAPEALQALVTFEQALTDDEDVRQVAGQAQVDSVLYRIQQITDMVAAGPGAGGHPAEPGTDAPVGPDPQALATLLAQVDAVGIGSLDGIDPQADVAALYDALLAVDPSAGAVLSRNDQGGYDATLVDVSTSAMTDVGQLAEDLDEDAEVLRDAGLDADFASEGLLIDYVLDQLRSSQITSLGLTLVASMLILSLVFWVRERKPMLGVLAIAAVGIVVAWVLGLMAVFGIPFNVMTAMVSALAIGIGVPYGIHVVNRFLEDRTRYPSLEDAVRQTLLHTGGALVGSAVTTIAGFGVLALSTVRPMKQFGIVTAMTIGLALLSSIAVLPAMLTVWSKRHEWSDEPPAPTDAPEGEVVPAPAARQP